MSLLEKIADLLFPDNLTCNSCGKEIFDGRYLCDECAKDFKLNDGPTCPVCGRKTTSPSLCLECKASAPLFKRAVSAAVYEGTVAKLVISFKNGSTHLKRYFASLMKDKAEEFSDANAICFVPMTKSAELKRGYNQSALLAGELGKRLNLPVLKGAIVKKKQTKSQKTLNFAARLENLKGCFTAYSGMVKGKRIILVDDVLTTGATAEAVTAELMKKGAECVYLATFASVEYKRPL